MSKDESRDRAIRCRYNPTEVGQYVLHIQWSGVHVPGSPFTVAVVDTRHELDLCAARGLAGGPPVVGCPGGPVVGLLGGEAPIFFGGGGPADLDGGGTLRMSTLSGDGLIFTDDN